MLLQLQQNGNPSVFQPIFSLEVSEDGLMIFNGRCLERYFKVNEVRVKSIRRKLSIKQMTDLRSLLKEAEHIKPPPVKSWDQTSTAVLGEKESSKEPLIISGGFHFPDANLVFVSEKKEVSLYSFHVYWEQMSKQSALFLTQKGLKDHSMSVENFSENEFSELARFHYLIFKLVQTLEVSRLIREVYRANESGETQVRKNVVLEWNELERIVVNQQFSVAKSANNLLADLLLQLEQAAHDNQYTAEYFLVNRNEPSLLTWVSDIPGEAELAESSVVHAELFRSANLSDDPELVVELKKIHDVLEIHVLSVSGDKAEANGIIQAFRS